VLDSLENYIAPASPLLDDRHPRPPGARLLPLVEKLDHGGMGEIWRAATACWPPVAVKLIRRS